MPFRESQDVRIRELKRRGASPTLVEELLIYNENSFQHPNSLTLPLEDELFVSAWKRYIEAAQKQGVFTSLQEALVQLQFPIQEGISSTGAYQAATRRGVSTKDMPEAVGLHLQYPDDLTLSLHSTPAGHIPILTVFHRADFETLIQAFRYKNEPVPVPASHGAGVVTGYNNWDRVRTLRDEWIKDDPAKALLWSRHFSEHIKPNKALYQDRFIILSDGFYSAVPAENLGLTQTEWKEESLRLRREHEATHYFTERCFSNMRNNLMDELIADYAGIVAARGSYSANWFLQFMGLRDFPKIHRKGRIQNYRGDPPLSENAMQLAANLLIDAAYHLEAAETVSSVPNERQVQRTIIALTTLTLEELASEHAEGFLQEGIRYADELLKL